MQILTAKAKALAVFWYGFQLHLKPFVISLSLDVSFLLHISASEHTAKGIRLAALIQTSLSLQFSKSRGSVYLRERTNFQRLKFFMWTLCIVKDYIFVHCIPKLLFGFVFCSV